MVDTKTWDSALYDGRMCRALPLSSVRPGQDGQIEPREALRLVRNPLT
jgi:hypothetical protein